MPLKFKYTFWSERNSKLFLWGTYELATKAKAVAYRREKGKHSKITMVLDREKYTPKEILPPTVARSFSIDKCYISTQTFVQ